MELIREIRDIDSDKIIINVPKEFRKRRVEILVLPLEELKKKKAGPEDHENEEYGASGLCGLWQDERSPEEIVNDIYSNRTGFGNRQVDL